MKYSFAFCLFCGVLTFIFTTWVFLWLGSFIDWTQHTAFNLAFCITAITSVVFLPITVAVWLDEQ